MYADDNTDTAAVDDARADASFEGGFAGVEEKTDNKPPANGKAEPARDAAQADAKPAPEAESEAAKISAKEWAEARAAWDAKVASYDHQLSKAFGTIGNLQKQLNGVHAKVTPPPEPPKEPFSDMEKEFPELAKESRSAFDLAVSRLEAKMKQEAAQREVAALEDAYPDWRTIVGAVDVTKEQPDPEHPYRKWLATKDAAYQDKINGSESHAVIGRSISLFKSETAAAAKPAATSAVSPRDTARRQTISAAVQPRGDNAGAAPANTSEDAFAAGFSRN